MKIFVAGGTGAIGRPLIEELLAKGHTVVGLTRSSEKARSLVERGVEPAIADVFDTGTLAVREWLPAFAHWLNAPPPPQISVEDALKASGADAVYYGTQMRGVSNDKAKRKLNFQPRQLEWLVDTAVAQGRADLVTPRVEIAAWGAPRPGSPNRHEHAKAAPQRFRDSNASAMGRWPSCYFRRWSNELRRRRPGAPIAT